MREFLWGRLEDGYKVEVLWTEVVGILEGSIGKNYSVVKNEYLSNLFRCNIWVGVEMEYTKVWL